jgi:NAD(P)-dependent dehydrogenase (short-subunit alcohol dehydrogenase family)
MNQIGRSEGMRRFEGKAVIVTGAASGIGRAAARLFAAEGAAVVAADRAPAVADVATAIADGGGAAFSVEMDAGDSADVDALVAAAVSRFGRLDAFFANAGVSGGFAGLFEQTADDWTAILRTNLIGPFLAVKAAAPEIAKQGGGAIVCTASVAGLRSGAGGPAYSASKAGVINLVAVAAQQLAGSGVRVNGICPGLIETGMTRPIFERAAERGTTDRIGQLNPLRRAGQPEEIARVAVFLASDEASYVNGHAVVVDGGLSSSLPVVPPKPKA